MGEQHQKTPIETIAILNAQYHLSIHGNSKEGKASAERAFYDSHDWLRKRRVKFHLRSQSGQWVIDEVVQ